MSSYYPPPPSRKSESNGKLWLIPIYSVVAGVVVAAMTNAALQNTLHNMPGSYLSNGTQLLILAAAFAIGALVGLIFGGRDWLAVKLSGGREPSPAMLSGLTFGAFGLIIFLVIAGFAVYLFHDMPFGGGRANLDDDSIPEAPVINPLNVNPGGPGFGAIPPPPFNTPPVNSPPPPPVAVPLPSIPLNTPVEPPPAPVVASVDPPPVVPAAPPEKPLEIPAGTSPKDANQLFVDRYGDEKVARFIIQADSVKGDPAAALREALATFVDAGQSPAIFISAQPGTIAALVAPVSDLDAASRKLGSAAQIKADRRMVAVKASALQSSTATEPLASAPQEEPKPDSAKVAAAERELKKLVAQLQKADVFSRKPIVAKIAALRIPAAAEALVKGLGTIDQHAAEEGLLQMGPEAFPALLAAAGSGDFGAAAGALRILGKIGTPDIIPALEKIENGNSRGGGFASFAIDEIKRRK